MNQDDSRIKAIADAFNELRLARAVIEAVRRHAHHGCCVSTWQDAAEAMREYDAAYPQEDKP